MAAILKTKKKRKKNSAKTYRTSDFIGCPNYTMKNYPKFQSILINSIMIVAFLSQILKDYEIGYGKDQWPWKQSFDRAEGLFKKSRLNWASKNIKLYQFTLKLSC